MRQRSPGKVLAEHRRLPDGPCGSTGSRGKLAVQVGRRSRTLGKVTGSGRGGPARLGKLTSASGMAAVAAGNAGGRAGQRSVPRCSCAGIAGGGGVEPGKGADAGRKRAVRCGKPGVGVHGGTRQAGAPTVAGRQTGNQSGKGVRSPGEGAGGRSRGGGRARKGGRKTGKGGRTAGNGGRRAGAGAGSGRRAARSDGGGGCSWRSL